LSKTAARVRCESQRQGMYVLWSRTARKRHKRADGRKRKKLCLELEPGSFLPPRQQARDPGRPSGRRGAVLANLSPPRVWPKENRDRGKRDGWERKEKRKDPAPMRLKTGHDHQWRSAGQRCHQSRTAHGREKRKFEKKKSKRRKTKLKSEGTEKTAESRRA